MFCPICKAEFREGFEECNTCLVRLVEDPDDITQPVEGEFKFCPQCEREFHDDTEFCAGCGLKMVRAVLRDDTYFFLEKPHDVYAQEPEPELISELEYYADLSEVASAVLLESEDIPLLVKIQELLNQEHINFQYVPPQEEPGMLGSLLGAGNPLTRSFPKVLVRAEDEERALRLIAEHPALGLLDIPEELLEDDDEDEGEDYDDFADLKDED